MQLDIHPFQLEGCQCRLKFDPVELQELLSSELHKKLGKKAKVLDKHDGTLTVEGHFTEIDEGNFALHFMLALLGKAWVAGDYRVSLDGNVLVEDAFFMKRTFAAFTNGKGQLKGDTKFVADEIVKKTVKAVKAL